MTPELYRRTGDLFEQLRVLSPRDRLAALNLACNGDTELRSHVLALLEADEHPDDTFLETPALEKAASLLRDTGGRRSEPHVPPIVAQRYRIESRIGAGGMGVVYRAEDLRLSRPVALKILTAASVDEERYLRFQREARAASQLNHPQITAIYDAGIDDGVAYIAMELVEGKTLRQMIAEQGKPEARAVLHIVGQVAGALEAAHKAGIVHRDIKPENIIVRPDGLAKVLDFGLARMRPAQSDPQNQPTLLTRPGQVAGTVQYLSPEQVLGEASGPESDIFSLGVVAYELATGVRPFDGPTDGAIFDAILHRKPKRPSQVRPELGSRLDSIILGALNKDTRARTRTAEQLRAECSGSAAPGRGVGLPRGRWKWRIAAVGLLAAAVAAGWLLSAPSEPRVIRTVQITHNGPVHEFATDGSRIYYAAGTRGAQAPVYQVSAEGGEPVMVPGLNGMMPLDVSADGSQLLLKQIDDRNASIGPLWQASLRDHTKRRLGDLEARYARWSSSGDRIVYAQARELRVAEADGSASRLVFSHNDGDPETPYFLAGDRRIRFSLVFRENNRLFDIDVDGSGLRPSLPEWDGGLQSFPNGSADGRFSAFAASRNNHDWDLWMFRERGGMWGFRSPQPVRLTKGEIAARRPDFSRDGRRVFFIGDAGHAELVQRNRGTGEWTPYLQGIDAFQLEFSRDKEWVTFVGPPGLSVWRRKVDGSGLLQLTEPPLNAVNPRWSPDGSKIVFYGGKMGQASGLYMVAATGGPVTAVLTAKATARYESEPSWSPDGNQLLYEVDHGMEIFDLQSRRVKTLLNSDGIGAPRWSPDGNYAVGADAKTHLILYDMGTHERTVLATVGSGYPSWSADSRYVYFLNAPCSMLYRVDVRTRELREFASMDGFRFATHGLGWVAVSPEGTVISARDVGTRNVYGLELGGR